MHQEGIPKGNHQLDGFSRVHYRVWECTRTGFPNRKPPAGWVFSSSLLGLGMKQSGLPLRKPPVGWVFSGSLQGLGMHQKGIPLNEATSWMGFLGFITGFGNAPEGGFP